MDKKSEVRNRKGWHTPSGVSRNIFCKNVYKGQEERFSFRKSLNLIRQKSAQEEIVGFAMIIIIVSVVLLVFFSISLKNNEREVVQNYEIESFIQALLQHTSECRKSDNIEYLSIQKLIFSCNSKEKCLDGKDSCEILEKTLKEIFDEYWRFGDDRPIKGRKLEILSEGKVLLLIQEGNATSNSKGAVQEFFRSGSQVTINFEVYY